jgi:hypothetical protein
VDCKYFHCELKQCFIGKELVGSRNKLWAVRFLFFFFMVCVAYCELLGCLLSCHSPDLLSGERLVVRYKPYCDLPGCMVPPEFGWFCAGWQWFHWCFSLFWEDIIAMSLCWVGISGAELFILIISFGFFAGFKGYRKDFVSEIGLGRSACGY